MSKYDLIIVGSGLYGATIAQQSRASGKSVLVIEKRENIAGNVFTENIEGINVLFASIGGTVCAAYDTII